MPPAATLSPKLDELISLLDDATSPHDLSEIERVLLDLEHLSIEDFAGHLQFSNDRYQRSYLKQCPAYDLLVVGWKPGQHSTIHDHRGSACGFRVIQGCGVETSFELNDDDSVIPQTSVLLPTGAVCVSECESIHAVSNCLSASEELVTLHLYAPAMPRMNEYTLDPSASDAWNQLISHPTHNYTHPLRHINGSASC